MTQVSQNLPTNSVYQKQENAQTNNTNTTAVTAGMGASLTLGSIPLAAYQDYRNLKTDIFQRQTPIPQGKSMKD